MLSDSGHIRIGLPEDRADVCSIECACFGRARFLFGLWPRVGRAGTVTLIAQCDHRPVGYLIAYQRALGGRSEMYVAGVAVRPSHRRAGLADSLTQAIRVAHPRLWLHVRESNVAALALYRKHGLSEKQRIERFYSNGETAIVLVTGNLSG